jgi:hypothetical protein
MDDKDVGDGPDAQAFDRFALLVALRTVVGVLLAQLLLARVLAKQRGKKGKLVEINQSNSVKL